MGLMMWLMGKGMGKKPSAAQPRTDPSVEQLREEHRRLASEIDRLEGQPASSGRG